MEKEAEKRVEEVGPEIGNGLKEAAKATMEEYS